MTPRRFLTLAIFVSAAGCHPLIMGAAAASGGGGGGGDGIDADLVSVTVRAVDRTFVVPGTSMDVTIDLGGIGGRVRALDFRLAPDGIGGSEPTIRLTPTSLQETAGSSATRTVVVPPSTPNNSYRLVAEVSGGGKTASAQYFCPIYVGPVEARPAAEVWFDAKFSSAQVDCTGLGRFANGDVVVTGDWAGTLTPAQQTAPDATTSFFLSRLRAADGNPVAEHFAVPDPASYAAARGVTVLADDTCVVIGSFRGTVDFGVDELTSLPRTGQSQKKSTFVARYVFVGDVVRIRNLAVFSATLDSQGRGLATLPDGVGTVAVGSWSGTATFGSISRTAAGDSDGFVMRLGNDLSVVWVAQIGSAVADLEECVAVAARQAGEQPLGAPPRTEIAVTGYVRSTATDAVVVGTGNGGPSATRFTESNSRDALVVSYLENGAVEWVTSWGGSGADDGRAIELSTNGGGVVFVGGNFTGSVETEAGTLVSLAPPSATNGFVAQFDGSGTRRWSAGLQSDGGASVEGVAFLNGVEELVVSGSFRGFLASGLVSDHELLGRARSEGDADAFLVNLRTNPPGGSVLRQIGFGGSGEDRTGVLLPGTTVGTYFVGASLRSRSVLCDPLPGFTLGSGQSAASVVIQLDLP